MALDVTDWAAVDRLMSDGRRRARSARHLREQRRRPGHRLLAGDDAGGMGPCRRRQPDGRLHLRTGGGAADGRGRPGQHHQHGLGGRASSRSPVARPTARRRPAVIALTKVLAVEWAAGTASGSTPSDRAGSRPTSCGPRSTRVACRRRTSHAGRRSGGSREPDEIADAALFLASDRSTYFTGQTLFPDGGFTSYGGWR